MALTASAQLPLGTLAPDFTLLDCVSSQYVSLASLRSEIATVIMFICNHCPYVKHIQSELVRLARDYQPKGVQFVAISSNDIAAYPEDAPEKMTEVARRLDYSFPYLYDETQMVAKAYQAVCTPDFYVYDKQLRLVYHGQLDDARPGNDITPNGRDIRQALDSMLQGRSIDPNQKASIGCSIKWRTL